MNYCFNEIETILEQDVKYVLYLQNLKDGFRVMLYELLTIKISLVSLKEKEKKKER